MATLSVAVVGSGPAGLYTAEALVKHAEDIAGNYLFAVMSASCDAQFAPAHHFFLKEIFRHIEDRDGNNDITDPAQRRQADMLVRQGGDDEIAYRAARQHQRENR